MSTSYRVEGVLQFRQRADGLHTEHVRLNVTHTNSEGDWLQNQFRDNIFHRETWNADGTLTVVQRHAGVQSKLRSSEGLTPVFDRGTSTFVIVIHFNDPEDEEDDEATVSWTFHGPHPEAESNFELFCEVVEDVLG